MAAMLASVAQPNLSSAAFSFIRRHHHHHHHHHPRIHLLPTTRRRSISISASRFPSRPPPSPSGEVYQPFRPPPSPLPAKYRSLDPAARLAILRDRLGQWHEYAPLIPSLAASGFTPPSIEEATGLSGVDQNRLTVAVQVRSSLLASSLDHHLLSFFDSDGGADLLYELRLLNATQRSAAAARIALHGLDPKAAQELARAVRDFPRRRGDHGWDRFDATSPDDCLAFTHYRFSFEATSPAGRIAALEKALEAAGTEGARDWIAAALLKATGGAADEEEEESVKVTVPVVRLRYGELAESTTVQLLPVCLAREGAAGLAAAPGQCRAEGALGVVTVEKEWGRWVVLPGWGPVAGAIMGVAVEFVDARVLPWRVNRWEKEEAVLVVADRGLPEVKEADGFYLFVGEDGGLEVERGAKLMERGENAALGTVVMVVKPPKEEEDDQLSDEDWV